MSTKKSVLKAHSHVQINQGDTINIYGDSLSFNGKTRYAKIFQAQNKFMICDNAIVMKYDSKDTLYIRADTLRRKVDSVTNHESLRAFYHVRILSQDIKGLCDSASYNDYDSLLHLYFDPILWSDNAQITSDSMKLKQADGKVKRIWVYENSMTIKPADSFTQKYFNQVSGRFITAYLDSNKLQKIKVIQNAQTVYFTVDNMKYSGMNVGKSKEIHLSMNENKIERVSMISKPVGTYYPFDQVPENKMKLEDFE